MNTSTIANLGGAARREISSGVVKLGRFGLAARGVVYLTVGVLAAKAAMGRGGKVTDQQGAVETLGNTSYGVAALWLVGIGLAGYTVWRLLQAVLDLDRKGTDTKGLVKRASAFISGLTYAGLSLAALTMAMGSSAPKGGEQSTADRTAWLMSQPFGRWLVGAVAVLIACVALYQFYQAISCAFTKHLRGGGLTPEQERWSRRAGQAGHAARGVAFSLIAWFFLQAAMHQNPSEAGGLGTALRTLERQPHGPWLLVTVGAGLALFGVYSLVEARYRRIGG